MSYYDEDYQRGQILILLTDLLVEKVGVTDRGLIRELLAPLEVIPYSQLTHRWQDELMVQVLQGHPELLAKWRNYWDNLPPNPVSTHLTLKAGLMLAPGEFRPLENPDQCIDMLKALVAPSFYVKTDKDGKKSLDLRSFGLVPGN